MTEYHDRLKSLFEQVIELPAAQRAAFADEHCADDPALRRDLESLIEHDDQRPSDYLDSVVDIDAPDGAMDEVATASGRFTLLEKLGEGGMGAVYRVRQVAPVQREVALKVIKLGMDTKQVIARFDAERQTLARMNHSGIARVLDAGMTDSGRPFFVMELVDGTPLTQYCDDRHLGVKPRLELFIDVCRAVQHAHQKGVVHRDLKPSNVLVCDQDNRPVPKVIDFGIAKAIDEPLAGDLTLTGRRQLMGTPAYMSPEQAGAGSGDIDTRSDIYSLGAMLYELLTSATPLASSTLRSVSPSEIDRVIREIEPARPSDRVVSPPPADSPSGGDSAESPSTNDLALRRGTDPTSLQRTIRGDLDWIVLKALAKDREHRYESASSLARDIERHLANEPVLAGPPGAGYRLRKFVRRHRASVAAGSLIAAALLVATVVSAGFAFSEAEQRKIATKQATRAEFERENAQAVNDFLTDDVLAAAAPSGKRGRGTDVLMGEVLDEAARRIGEASRPGGRLAGRPLIEASIRLSLGETYRLLGRYDESEIHLQLARSLRARELGEDQEDTVAAASYLGRLYLDQGRLDEAEPLLMKTLATLERTLGAEHPRTLISRRNLAWLHEDQGEYTRAEPLHVEVLASAERTLGEDDQRTAEALGNLAILYLAQGRFAEAEPLFVRAVDTRKRILGDEHPNTLASMTGLANLYYDQGRNDDAVSLHGDILRSRRRILGDEHPDTLWSMNNLANAYMRDPELFADAEPLLQKTLEGRRRVLPVDHPDTLAAMNNLGAIHFMLQHFDTAQEIFEELLAAQERVLGTDHPDRLTSMVNLAQILQYQERFEEAVAIAAEAVASARRAWPEGSTYIGAFLATYGGTLIEVERYDKAEEVLMEAYGLLEGALGEDHPWTIAAMQALEKLYNAADRPNDAAKWRARLGTATD